MIYFLKLRTFLKSSFFKNITILSGGSALSQIIGILISPILSRLYTPKDFGLVGSLLAFTSVISLIGSLKYDQAIVTEKNNQSANSLIDLSVILISVISIISVIILFTAPYWLDFLNEKNELVKLFPFAFPIIFFSSLYNVYSTKFNRDKEYKLMAAFQIIKKLSTSFSQMSLGFFSASALGLILGNVFGVLIPIIFLIFIKQKSFPLYNFSSIESLKKVSKRYYKFPLYIAPQSFMNLLSAQLPVFVLGYFFSASVVGAYFFTLKLIQVPANFIGLSFRQVFYQEASQFKEDLNKVESLFKKITLILFLIMIIPSLILFFYGENIFVFAFGSQWSLAGLFASWMILWYGSNIVIGPARSLFLVYEQQKMVLFIDSILFIIRITALLSLSMNFDSIIVIKWFSIISLLFNLIVITWWLNYFKKNNTLIHL